MVRAENLTDGIEHNVVPVLPAGACLLNASKHGKSLWNQTYRLETRLAGGQLSSYFLKIAKGPQARAMVRGEYESAKSLRAVNASCTPKPIAIGPWNPCQDTHFILFDFVDMAMDVLDVLALPEIVAKLHRDSMTAQRKFGFHVPTYHGLLPQKNDWADTWEGFFAAAMKFSLELETTTNGPHAEIGRLSVQVFDRVIPRLLRPLESQARKIKPCLVHGDLWLGNFSIDKSTKRPVIFDACAFWGHNDLGEWGSFRSDHGASFWSAYKSILPVSFPEEDFEDRICLYGIRFNLHDSALFPSDTIFRNLVLKAMIYLVRKYPII